MGASTSRSVHARHGLRLRLGPVHRTSSGHHPRSGSSKRNRVMGALLLTSYSLGLGLPFVVWPSGSSERAALWLGCSATVERSRWLAAPCWWEGACSSSRAVALVLHPAAALLRPVRLAPSLIRASAQPAAGHGARSVVLPRNAGWCLFLRPPTASGGQVPTAPRKRPRESSSMTARPVGRNGRRCRSPPWPGAHVPT